MKQVKELLLGLLTSLATALLVLGALSISITEGMVFVPTRVVESTPNPLEFDLTTLLPEQPHTAIASNADHIITATPPALQSCNYPKKWIPYTIEIGDTLKEIAQEFGITQQELKEANCLFSDELVPGTDIYVPPIQPTSTSKPTRSPEPSTTNTRVPTRTVSQCSPPAGWIAYQIQPGENLFRIGLRYNVTAEELRRVNCLASSDRIIAGAIIYVPNVPTIAPTHTRTSQPPSSTPKPTRTFTPTSSFTATIPAATSTVTPSATATFTVTATGTFTSTTVPSETLTSTSTESPVPTSTTPAP